MKSLHVKSRAPDAPTDPGKMRVLHVVCDLHGGGAERLVLDLCRRAPAHVESAVATIHSGGALHDLFIDEGVEVLDAGRVRGRLGVRATGRLAAWLRQADVVHTHLWAGDTWGRIAALLVRHPCVVTTEHNTRVDAAWRGRVSRALAGVSRRIVCVSDAAADAVRETGVPSERLEVIQNGIDLTRFQAGPCRPGKAMRVLGIGRLCSQKGFDVLAEVANAEHELEIAVVGDGDDRDALSESRLELRGWRSDVRSDLAWADVVAIPSRWEGFGLVAVEAMASGVPVVASRIEPLVSVLGEAAVWVAPEDPDALGRALLELGANATRRAALAAMGIERARHFSIDETANRYAQLYAQLLSRG